MVDAVLAMATIAIEVRVSSVPFGGPDDGAADREQTIINQHVDQLSLVTSPPQRPLQPPRFTCFYRYRCESAACNGHPGTVLDWEDVALQRRRTFSILGLWYLRR